MSEKTINPHHDGVTHINISTGGKHKLGQDLSNFAGFAINHPDYGYFRTIEGFWQWLATGKNHDIFRNSDGWTCKRIQRAKGYNDHADNWIELERVNVENFEKEIIKAWVLRFEQHPLLKQEFVESTLPFEHYFVKDNTVNTLDFLAWIPVAFGELRSELQLNSVFDPKRMAVEATETLSSDDEYEVL